VPGLVDGRLNKALDGVHEALVLLHHLPEQRLHLRTRETLVIVK